MVGSDSDYDGLHDEAGVVIVEPTGDLYPDEDWVGEQFLGAYSSYGTKGPIYKLIYDSLEDCNQKLLDEIEDLEYEHESGRGAYDEYDEYIHYGKKIIYCLENLKPEVMAEIASYAPNLSHAGDLKIKEAWVFDTKTVNPKLEEDGSNLFEHATQIYP